MSNRMSKRQPIKPFDVPNMKYTFLHQDGNNDRYKVVGRNTLTGKIEKIIGTQAQVEEKIGKALFENFSEDHHTDTDETLTTATA